MSGHYTPELQEEKRKDYRNVVGAQSILLVISLLTDDWLHNSTLTFTLFQICCAVYLYLLWDLSRNFTFKRWLPNLLGGLASGVVLVSLLNNFVLWQPGVGSLVNEVLHGTTIWIQSVVMWLGLRDLVRGPRNAADKLWAAAGLYIMLGIVFGEIVHFVHMLRPETLGPGIQATVQGFHEALYLSFVTLTGADNALSGISHFCRNILALESLMAQLYLVMLISRLLADGRDTSDEGVESGLTEDSEVLVADAETEV